MEETPKSKILEHVLYEFQMYLETYIHLKKLDVFRHASGILGVQQTQFEYNMTIESHERHLRNMIEFFNTTKPQNFPNDLRVFDILKNGNNFTIEKDQSKYNHISKSVEHLTKDRIYIDKNKTNNYIDQYYKVFKRNIADVMSNLEKEIVEEYEEELREPDIKFQITYIKNILK